MSSGMSYLLEISENVRARGGGGAHIISAVFPRCLSSPFIFHGEMRFLE